MLTFLESGLASLRIEGSATIARAAQIRSLIAEAMAEARDIDIAFEEWPTDVAVLQLLISARRSAKVRGGSVRLAGVPSEQCLDALAAGGFLVPGFTDEIWLTEVKP